MLNSQHHTCSSATLPLSYVLKPTSGSLLYDFIFHVDIGVNVFNFMYSIVTAEENYKSNLLYIT